MVYFKSKIWKRSLKCLFIFVTYLTISNQSPRITNCKRRQGWANVAGYLTESAVDRFQCIRKCLQQEQCLAITYTDSNNTCAYFVLNQLHLTNTTTDQGITFVREVPVVLVSDSPHYQYNFDTAVGVCDSFGGQLIGYEDLETAWESGLAFCRCAWLSNGRHYFAWALPAIDWCENLIGDCTYYRNVADAWCSV